MGDPNQLATLRAGCNRNVDGRSASSAPIGASMTTTNAREAHRSTSCPTSHQGSETLMCARRRAARARHARNRDVSAAATTGSSRRTAECGTASDELPRRRRCTRRAARRILAQWLRARRTPSCRSSPNTGQLPRRSPPVASCSQPALPGRRPPPACPPNRA